SGSDSMNRFACRRSTRATLTALLSWMHGSPRHAQPNSRQHVANPDALPYTAALVSRLAHSWGHIMRFLRVIAASAVLLFHALSAGAQQADTPEALLQKAKAVLSQLDGEIALPGLKEPVEVLRDRWGVPHIYAKNADDLFFAQGFVVAQDRLFQMDLWRRIGIGETAEILGKSSLEGDRFARLLRYRGDMDAEWASYSPDAKRIATAFTRGI